MPIKLSIILCTYNRAEFLATALQSLVDQTVDKDLFEVIVVNNNSTDGTLAVAQQFEFHSSSNIRTVTEKQQGLSHARNRGYREARADWVGYLDDDARAPANYIKRILYVIENYPFDCFGGIYLPWYKYGKPKWFLDSYGSNGRLLEHTGILDRGNLSGGVIVFKKSILERLGGFCTDLGMQGRRIAYGEESQLQVKMRKRGYIVGFDPDLQIEHVVNRYKLTPWWFIRAAYMRGRCSWQTFGLCVSRSLLVKNLLEGVFLMLKHLLYCTPQLMRKEYYLQNWLIDVLRPLAYRIGQFLAGLSKLPMRRASYRH